MNEGRVVRKQPCRGAPPEQDGDREPDYSHEERRAPNSGQGPQISLQAHIEEEDQHSNLGQDQQGRIRSDKRDPLPSEERREKILQRDSDQQFSEDRRLPPPFGEEAPDLCRSHEDRQPKQDRARLGVPLCASRPGESRSPGG